MKAIVTGGAGFIGSHIVERLLKVGHEVVSLDNYITGKKENLKSLQCPRLQEVYCDITDMCEVDKYMKGMDVIFHQAASKYTHCVDNPNKDLKTNIKGTFNLLRSAIKYNVRKFVHASTGSVYGKHQGKPFSETDPTVPISFYGVSKLSAEKYVQMYHSMYGLDTTILRYSSVYGSRQDSGEKSGVVSKFIRLINEGKPLPIYGDGNQVRSFTYVTDVVEMNIEAMKPQYSGEIFNCASGLVISINDIVKYLEEIYNKKLEIEYLPMQEDSIINYQVDNSKIKQAFGMEFMTDIELGLVITAESMK